MYSHYGVDFKTKSPIESVPVPVSFSSMMRFKSASVGFWPMARQRFAWRAINLLRGNTEKRWKAVDILDIFHKMGFWPDKQAVILMHSTQNLWIFFNYRYLEISCVMSDRKEIIPHKYKTDLGIVSHWNFGPPIFITTSGCSLFWPNGTFWTEFFAGYFALCHVSEFLSIHQVSTRMPRYTPRKLTVRTRKLMVGRLLSFWQGLFSGSMVGFLGCTTGKKLHFPVIEV